MNVKELIQALEGLPQDLEVRVEVPCCCGSFEPATKVGEVPVMVWDPDQVGSHWKDSGRRIIRIGAEMTGDAEYTTS